MAPFLKQFEETLLSFSLPRGSGVLVALSGGADSVALLLAMHRFRKQLGLSLHAAHLNHGFRPKESGEEETFCTQLCNSHDIPLAIGHYPRDEASGSDRESLQMAARTYRYRFLEKTAEENGCRFIALGHHLDDSVETVFLKLLSGCAPAALAGIPERIGNRIRPLSRIPADGIRGWLESIGQDWREDSSNRKDVYSRNYLRNTVFPLFKERWPSFTNSVTRLSSLVREENAFWTSLFIDRKLPLPAMDTPEICVPLDRLRKLEPVVFRRYLALLCSRFTRPPATGFYRSAQKFLRDDVRREWFRADGYTLYAEYGHLRLECIRLSAPLPPQQINAGDNPFPGGRFSMEEVELPVSADRKFFQGHAKNGIFFFNSLSLTERLIMRSAHAGDRIELSPGVSKKVGDLFTDMKIPLHSRQNGVVFEDTRGIVAIFLPDFPDKLRVAHRVFAKGGAAACRMEYRAPE